ncbi:MAG: glycosyltransferase [Candidatus Hydrogenedens sp.]|nr:glycosyltransferase [Candidatus Hydrogenedens sp.]
MAAPRILTFNFHEPYLCLMAKCGYPLDVGVYESGYLAREWMTRHRPMPENITLLGEADWKARAQSGYYDAVIAQNEMNALDLLHCPSPKVLLCHNRRQFLESTAQTDRGDPREEFDKMLAVLRAAFGFVFISETKRQSYGIAGSIVLPGIDLDEFHGYTGEEARVIRVGNNMRERNLMFDVDFQEAACVGLPNRVAGVNVSIPGSAPAETYEDLLELYRRNRCMLHVTRQAYEDGYNLAMLEAMATGMPVVSLANATSPLTDGVDGFVSDDAGVLHERLKELLADTDLARRMGAAARETIAERFPLDAFTQGWREIIDGLAARSGTAISAQPDRPAGSLNVLLHYVMNPLTTGRYVEEALRAKHQVMTAGFRIPEEVLQLWGFESPPPYRAHEIDLPHKAPYAQLLAYLPESFHPDIYLYIDSGPTEIEPDIELIDAPKIAWLIDTHVNFDSRLAMARYFDCVFLAHQAQVEPFRVEGIEHVYWLPLACSPELHALPEQPRDLDVACVGSFSQEEGGRRDALLRAVGKRFPNHFIGRAWPDDMATIYNRAKIVVNASFKDDVNMRVFEGIAAGALLLTDRVTGLDALLKDGEHLALYEGEQDLLDKIDYYLSHDAEREAIAAAGRAEVLENHTYARRIESMLRRSRGVLGGLRRPEMHHKKKHENYYQHVRRELFPHIPRKTRRLLDVGCGQGTFASTLKRERALEHVAGIEIVEEAFERAVERLDEAYNADIERVALPFKPASFDCIVCADVIEHLVDPRTALEKLSKLLTPEGVIVISVPNVRYVDVIDTLSRGFWYYVEEGIMDSTHIHWFTKRGIEARAREAGLEVLVSEPLSSKTENRTPRNEDGSVTIGKLTLHGVSDQEYEELHTYQHLLVAGLPGVDRMGRAWDAFRGGEYETAYALAFDATGSTMRDRYFLMARALAKLGKLADAAEVYDLNLDVYADPEAAAEFGILLVAMDQAAKARPLLEFALDTDPAHARARGALGLLDWQEGQADTGFEHLRVAAEASFDHASLAVPLAEAARACGRLDEALPLLRGYADFYPGNVSIVVALAAALADTGDTYEARAKLEELQLFHPADTAVKAALDSLNAREHGA